MENPAFLLICLFININMNRSLKEHLENFLFLASLSSLPDDCLCFFLYAGLNTATKEQWSGEGHRGSFADFVEWELESCGSPLTIRSIDNDASPTPNSSPLPPCCEEQQHEPTANGESVSATMFLHAPGGTIEPDITSFYQVCKPAVPSVSPLWSMRGWKRAPPTPPSLPLPPPLESAMWNALFFC